MTKREEQLKDLICKMYEELRSGMAKNWNRDIPFEELLFDRWGRAKKLGFGENSSIYHNSYVYGDVRVGKNTWIGPFTILDGSGGLEIGDFCSISAGVQIYSHNSVKWALSGGKKEYEKSPVKIADCCYIGPQSVISNGVSIGRHSVIGSNSFVNKEIPEYSIAFGTPIKIVGKITINNKNGGINFEYFTNTLPTNKV